MKRKDLDMTMEKKKCLLCGKEFTPWDEREVCCHGDCKYTYNTQKKKILSKISSIEKNFDFYTKNVDAIVKAKIRAFKDGDIHKCPCHNDDEHYCGSARCIADVVYLGKCGCNLFHSKKEPLINKIKDVK